MCRDGCLTAQWNRPAQKAAHASRQPLSSGLPKPTPHPSVHPHISAKYARHQTPDRPRGRPLCPLKKGCINPPKTKRSENTRKKPPRVSSLSASRQRDASWSCARHLALSFYASHALNAATSCGSTRGHPWPRLPRPARPAQTRRRTTSSIDNIHTFLHVDNSRPYPQFRGNSFVHPKSPNVRIRLIPIISPILL